MISFSKSFFATICAVFMLTGAANAYNGDGTSMFLYLKVSEFKRSLSELLHSHVLLYWCSFCFANVHSRGPDNDFG